MRKSMIITFLCGLIRAYVLALLAYRLGVAEPVPAIELGLAVALGIEFASIIPSYYFPNRPRRLLLIDGGNTALVIVAATLIVALWR